MTTHVVQWILIRYTPPGGDSLRFGILLYDSEEDKIHLRLREDVSFAPEDEEVVSETKNVFAAIVHDAGSQALFNWASTSLSNVLSADGPFEKISSDPRVSVDELYMEHCTDHIALDNTD